MALQYSTAVINARLDAVESTTGTSPRLRIYSGAAPANTAAAATGTMLVEITLPVDWMNAATTATKTKLGTWSANASAAGTAGYFRVVDSTGNTTHIQGTAGNAGSDMILDNASIAVSQTVTVNTFTLNGANL